MADFSSQRLDFSLVLLVHIQNLLQAGMIDSGSYTRGVKEFHHILAPYRDDEFEDEYVIIYDRLHAANVYDEFAQPNQDLKNQNEQEFCDRLFEALMKLMKRKQLLPQGHVIVDIKDDRISGKRDNSKVVNLD
jgi:hypothetical protein